MRDDRAGTKAGGSLAPYGTGSADEAAATDLLGPAGPDLGDASPGMSPKARLIAAAVLVVIALVSAFVLAPWTSSLETHIRSITALDSKRDTVMKLVEGSTASSAAISLLPGDAGTPIAEKLVDLSSDFLIVLAAIYLEKYLLAIMGTVSFKVLVPVACALGLAALALKERSLSLTLRSLALRLLVFAVAAYLVVPASVYVSGMIESTYQASIDATLSSAVETAQEVGSAASSQQEDQEEAGSSAQATTQGGTVLDFIAQIPQAVSSTVGTAASTLTEKAQQSLNQFIEALAVMIVTSCVIPILVLIFFLWLARVILGLDVTLPAMPAHARRHLWGGGHARR